MQKLARQWLLRQQTIATEKTITFAFKVTSNCNGEKNIEEKSGRSEAKSLKLASSLWLATNTHTSDNFAIWFSNRNSSTIAQFSCVYQTTKTKRSFEISKTMSTTSDEHTLNWLYRFRCKWIAFNQRTTINLFATTNLCHLPIANRQFIFSLVFFVVGDRLHASTRR